MAWLVWLIGAVALAVGEMVSLDLVLLMLAGGALGGTAAALLGLGVPLQLAVFVVVSAGLLAVVRPVARRHLVERTPEQIDGVAALVGSTAVVTERVDERDGRITLGADVWTARTPYEGRSFEVGDEVRIVQIDGATAVVDDPRG